jgi:Transposase
MEIMRVFGEVALSPTSISVAFEATFGWGWFADLLQDAGMEAHMSHPLATKAIASVRVKNDAVDARTLAQLLRTGMLPEAWMVPREVREARRLVRTRVSLVRIRTRIKSQVHGLLAEHGVANPVSDLFGKRGRQILEQLRLPELSQNRVEACLRLVDDIDKEIETADTEILGLYETDPRTERLLPIPGDRPHHAGHHPGSCHRRSIGHGTGTHPTGVSGSTGWPRTAGFSSSRSSRSSGTRSRLARDHSDRWGHRRAVPTSPTQRGQCQGSAAQSVPPTTWAEERYTWTPAASSPTRATYREATGDRQASIEASQTGFTDRGQSELVPLILVPILLATPILDEGF